MSPLDKPSPKMRSWPAKKEGDGRGLESNGDSEPTQPLSARPLLRGFPLTARLPRAAPIPEDIAAEALASEPETPAPSRPSGRFRNTSPDEDTQPIETAGPHLFAQLQSNPKEADTEPPPPPSIPPVSFRPSSLDVEGRISMDIPPPSRLDPETAHVAGAQDPYLGTTFDRRYKIEQIIGEGGMGFVYLARHKAIDKRVAIKVLRRDMARDRENVERFAQEARAASSIGNPHIVDISDFGDLPDGSTYFVMEYLDGVSLSRILDKERRLSVDRICDIAIQIADGLAAAHERGIVHRDLKPDNILLVTRGSATDFVKILDFGIAKVQSTEEKLTMAGAVFGTPHYMSPEQSAGTPVDARTDIYSLGVMMYELQCGQLPFNADNFMAILSQHMYQAPAPVREVYPDCSPTLEAVILKCMSKKPEARYASMAELRSDLEKVKRGEIPNAVAELVTRGDGFTVPPQYFKSKSSSPSLPPVEEIARAKKRSVLGIFGIGAAVLAAISIVLITQLGAKTPRNEQAEPGGSALSTQVPDPAAPSGESAPPGPKTIPVGLASIPEKAVAYLDGKPIKLPTTIEVEEGRSISVEVKADGYEPAMIVLDGKERIKLVKLTKIASTSGPKPSSGASSKDPRIVDPFDPRYQKP